MRTRWALLAVFFFTTQVAWGQQAATVDPYEVLYGKRLALPRRPIPESALEPPRATLKLVQERTDLLLNRLGLMTETLARKASVPPIKGLAEVLQQQHAKLLTQRTEDRPLATLWNSSALFLVTSFFGSVHEAVLRAAPSDAAPDPPSRLPELRARLEAFQSQVLRIKPQSAAAALAIAEAEVAWVDLSGLLDLLQHRPGEFHQLLSPTLELPQEARERIMRLVVEPIAVPLVDWWLEEAELLLQASLAEPATQPLRLDDRALRALARKYQDVATVNLKLLASRGEGASLPQRDKIEQLIGRLSALLIVQRLDYAQQHRDDPGSAAALTLLGASFAAYRSTLSAHELLEIATAPVLDVDPARNTADKAQAASRQQLLDVESLRARQAAALVQSALGIVPAPVLLAAQLGRELSEQPGDAQEWALEEFLDAQAMAQLAIALVVPSPGSASRGTSGLLPGPSDQEQEEAIIRCVEGLREPSSGEFNRAVGYAYNRRWHVQGGALRALIDDAIVSTCVQARFLNDKISWYFWRVYKNEYARRRREVDGPERPTPRLDQTCEDSAPNAAEELEEQEECTLRQRAIGQLSAADRTLLGWYSDDGLSLMEISGRLGISYDAARMRLKRALGRWKKAIRELDPISLRLPGPPSSGVDPGRTLWATLLLPALSDLRQQKALLSFF